MQVIKRNGQKIDFNPNKILLRIKKQSEGLKVNPDELFLKVTQGIADNMTTNEVDDLISIVAESLSMNHPDYSTLAAKISISKLHKETEDSFMKATKKQYNAGLLNDVYYNKVKENIELIESVIDYKRDFNFDYFGWCSLKDIYLLKMKNGQLVERPQQLYVRVALMVTNTPDDFREKYNDLSNQMESPATPIKINIGTKIGQIASCFDEDTNVYIQDKGLIPIKEVKVGDITITHKNNLKKVKTIWKNEVGGRKMFKFETNITKPIICTENHEFFSISKEQLSWGLDPSFNSIEFLREGDFIKNYNHESNEKLKDSIKIGDDYYSQIIKKDLIDYDKEIVYNLEVEDDNSYTVEGIIAKNCNLSIVPDDSTEGLLNMLGRISISSSKAEGIGLAVSNIRSKETNVGNSDGKAGGILKYLKVINEALRFWNQRGKRPGSCAIYIEPWHKDIFDILDMRKKTGEETLRARDLFSALWIPDNFMRAVEENTDWYLFCPHEIKMAGLKPFYEIYGSEYEEEYNKAVELGIGTKIKVRDLWLKILEAQIESGMPYMCFKDSANIKSNQKNMGVIHSSNLCCLDGDTTITIMDTNDIVSNVTMEAVVNILKQDNNIKVLSQDNVFRPMLAAAKMKSDFVIERATRPNSS